MKGGMGPAVAPLVPLVPFGRFGFRLSDHPPTMSFPDAADVIAPNRPVLSLTRLFFEGRVLKQRQKPKALTLSRVFIRIAAKADFSLPF